MLACLHGQLFLHYGDFKGSDINLSECNMNGNKHMGNEMRFKQFQQDLTVLIKLSLNGFLNKHKSSWRATAFVKNKEILALLDEL